MAYQSKVLWCYLVVCYLMACSTLSELQPTEATPKPTPEPKIVVIAGHLTETGNVDGEGEQARFRGPFGLDVDNSSHIFVADTGNHKIRKITPDGQVSTLAGADSSDHRLNFYQDGPAHQAFFNWPEDLVVDQSGNIFVADNYNNRIRKITPNGMVSTFAGSGSTILKDKLSSYLPGGKKDGPADQATFLRPSGLDIDKTGNVFVLEAGNGLIRKITPEGYVSTVTGKTSTVFNTIDVLQKLAFDSQGNLYFANRLIVGKLMPSGEISFIGRITQEPDLGGYYEGGFQDGAASQAQFDRIYGLDVDHHDNVLVADTFNHKIRKITPDGTVSTLISVEKPRDIAVGQDGTIYAIQGQQIIKIVFH